MKCPHCLVMFHAQWAEDRMNIRGADREWGWRATICPNCKEPTVELGVFEYDEFVQARWANKFMIHPRFSARSPIDDSVPASFKADYMEACNVLDISPKASAALSRRVVQGILQDQGYESSNLARQIDQVLAESDPDKVLSHHIRVTVDAVRNFGNFAAHPITEVTSLQVVDVEPEEAEWCLEIVEALFDHYYVTPGSG